MPVGSLDSAQESFLRSLGPDPVLCLGGVVLPARGLLRRAVLHAITGCRVGPSLSLEEGNKRSSPSHWADSELTREGSGGTWVACSGGRGACQSVVLQKAPSEPLLGTLLLREGVLWSIFSLEGCEPHRLCQED